MNPLTSKLMAPGTKFIVTDDIKDNTFGPGTIGIMSYIIKKDVNFENVAHAYVTIIRRGKGGMDRVNHNQINFPIFFDKRMLEHEDYLPTKRKYHVNIKAIDYETLNLLKVKPLDFLGWASAYASYIKYIINSMAITSQGVWPSDPGNVMNIARRIASSYDESKKSTEKYYANNEWRRMFIIEARRMESALIRCVLKYRQVVSDITKNAANFIKFTNDGYYKVADEKDIEKTIKFCDEKSKFIGRMIKEKDRCAEKSKNFGG